MSVKGRKEGDRQEGRLIKCSSERSYKWENCRNGDTKDKRLLPKFSRVRKVFKRQK